MSIYGKKRGQLAIIIIVALVIVGGFLVYFSVKGNLFSSDIPGELQDVYSYYSSCIEEQTRSALDIAGSQGGKIYLEDYVPGSEFSPSGNQLNFLGFPVQYWYYISNNGVQQEDVPSKGEIEGDIESYLENSVINCNFDNFRAEGYSIILGKPSADVRVNDLNVDVKVNSELSVSRENLSARKGDFDVSLNSKFGKFYNLAKEIYSKEQDEAFLENYAVDVVRLYAPVDGLEIQCSPKIWKANEVADEIKSGLEANIAFVKFKGDYYSLNDKKDEYYIVDKEVDENINLIYNKNWPTKIEIFGADNELLIAQPVGNQEGLGILGFCYAPYHFVYDVNFPILIQIYNGDETFQFPVTVVVDNNVARESRNYSISEEPDVDFCEFKNEDVEISVYDVNLNRVNANISYKCFNQECLLGETINGVYAGGAQGCANGYLIADADGYARKEKLFSSNEENSADIILDREYEVEIFAEIDGNPSSSNILISFEREDGKSVSAFLPGNSKVKLSEGFYNISAYAYGDANVVLPASTKTQCFDKPRGIIGGLFGISKEECVDITIPETKISSALIGGGKGQEYLLPDDLEEGKITIQLQGLPNVNSLEQLQYNYELFDSLNVYAEYG